MRNFKVFLTENFWIFEKHHQTSFEVHQLTNTTVFTNCWKCAYWACERCFKKIYLSIFWKIEKIPQIVHPHIIEYAPCPVRPNVAFPQLGQPRLGTLLIPELRQSGSYHWLLRQDSDTSPFLPLKIFLLVISKGRSNFWGDSRRRRCFAIGELGSKIRGGERGSKSNKRSGYSGETDCWAWARDPPPRPNSPGRWPCGRWGHTRPTRGHGKEQWHFYRILYA